MSSTAGASSGTDLLTGYVCLFVSCASFGFMFAPLKRKEPGDGFFVQWVQCSVVFLFGCVINVARGLPPFNLIASIGGALYATGNIGSIPIVGEMGIGVGMLVWGSVQIVVGWCVARLGLFGTNSQSVHNEALNYAGVVLTLLSGVMFVFVYSKASRVEAPMGRGRAAVHDAETSQYGSTNHQSPAVNELECVEIKPTSTTPPPQPSSEEETLAQPRWSLRKSLFLAFAVCLGCLHGLMMTPIVYVQDRDPNHSDNVLDYIFSTFTAIYFFSTLYFILYALVRREKAYVHRRLVLPSLAYGVLWSVGMVLWIVSNRLLSQTVSFPITVRLPAIIGALSDVFLFREIQGRRSLLFLFGAISIGVLGVTLVALSL